jgi:acyl dehydratase
MNPPRTPTYFWEDFHAGRVFDLGATDPVTRDAIIGFAREFDPQPFHLDDAAAEASLFGRLAASGWHTAAMTMRAMCDGYLLDSASLGSPGIESLRWLKPVFVGDRLHVRMVVIEARASKSRPGVGLVLSRWEVRNQHDEPVMTMEGWGMFRRRAGGGAPAADAVSAPSGG